MAYRIKLEVFEGPLDLLLYLIKKEELDIYDIPIAKITDEYVEYLDLMRMLDLNIAGEFLLMAATLMHIKSRMLLPPEERPELEEEEEDPRAELVRRLLEYKKFKEAALQLSEFEARQKEIFPRVPDELTIEPVTQRYFEASLFDLISSFSSVLKQIPRDVFYQVIADEVTVEQKMHELLHMLIEKPVIYLKDLFCAAKNKIEMVIMFISILELIRLKEIFVKQTRLFGDIVLMRSEKSIAPTISSMDMKTKENIDEPR